jgi:hypothetical protein
MKKLILLVALSVSNTAQNQISNILPTKRLSLGSTVKT